MKLGFGWFLQDYVGMSFILVSIFLVGLKNCQDDPCKHCDAWNWARILADLQLNVGVSIHIPTVKFQHVGVMIVY